MDNKIDQFMSDKFCSICGEEGKLERILFSDYIKRQLEIYFHDRAPRDIGIMDYKIYRCPRCSLGWSSPMRSGSKEFYNWITAKPEYYCDSRWEWNVVVKQLKARPHLKIVDIGCGDGKFLKKCLAELKDPGCFGIDATRHSAKVCKKNGIKVFCGDIKGYLKTLGKVTDFDVVTCFHCLEHVENPVEFISEALKLLKNGGILFISTPYASLFGEMWYEVLSTPHITLPDGE